MNSHQFHSLLGCFVSSITVCDLTVSFPVYTRKLVIASDCTSCFLFYSYYPNFYIRHVYSCYLYFMMQRNNRKIGLFYSAHAPFIGDSWKTYLSLSLDYFCAVSNRLLSSFRILQSTVLSCELSKHSKLNFQACLCPSNKSDDTGPFENLCEAFCIFTIFITAKRNVVEDTQHFFI